MNYQQVLALIQQFIVANGNNEITANVLRPILEAILAQPNELIGDLDDLQTSDQSNLVNAINEVLNNIAPQIGSVNTKIHALSLSGIDPDLPELTKIVEAVKLRGPFTCDEGQQMVFKTITTVGDIDAGAIVITRYYRLLRNLITIGGPSTYQNIPVSWFMQDGVSEYATPDADGTIIELGDIGTSEVWDVFNLGNNGDAWDMNEYRFVRAIQNGGIQLWAFVGQERYYGGPDMGIEPDIYEAFESDFFLITDQSDDPAPFNIFKDYDDIGELVNDQSNQSDQEIYYVDDASADTNLEFETGETKLQAFYRYNGVATGSIDDYTLISAPYSGSPGGVQSVTGDGVSGTPEDVVMTFPTPAEINAEEDLGLPSADGQILSSTELGVRSWVNLPAPPDINLQAFFEEYRQVWTGGSQVFQMQSAVKFMFGVYVNGVKLDETQIDRNDEFGRFEILDPLDVNDIVTAVYQEDENIMLLPYTPTTSLNFLVQTASGDDWEIDWEDGVWEQYASSNSIYRTKTFGTPTAGVARVRSATGKGLDDFYRVQSTDGTWSFDVADLCATNRVHFAGNSMALTGNVADIKATHTAYFSGNSMTLTGVVGDIKATITARFNGNSMELTGDVADVKATHTASFSGTSMELTYTTTTWTKIPTATFLLSLATGHLTTSELSQMLVDMDASGITGTATLDLRYNNGAPNAAGITAANNLMAKGYTVLTN